MNAHTFLSMLKPGIEITPDVIVDLRKILEENPYFHNGQVIYHIFLALQQPERRTDHLNIAYSYASNSYMVDLFIAEQEALQNKNKETHIPKETKIENELKDLTDKVFKPHSEKVIVDKEIHEEPNIPVPQKEALKEKEKESKAKEAVPEKKDKKDKKEKKALKKSEKKKAEPIKDNNKSIGDKKIEAQPITQETKPPQETKITEQDIAETPAKEAESKKQPETKTEPLAEEKKPDPAPTMAPEKTEEKRQEKTIKPADTSASSDKGDRTQELKEILAKRLAAINNKKDKTADTTIEEKKAIAEKKPSEGINNQQEKKPSEESKQQPVQPEKKDKKKEQSNLIDKFIKDEPSIKPIKGEYEGNIEKVVKSTQENDDIISETLAEIQLKQGNTSKAIEMFEKLSLKFPEKSSYFAARIEKIKKNR